MKCFTIQSGDEFIADLPRVVTYSHYHGPTLNTVVCDDEAKHYKTVSPARSWLKKTTESMQLNYDRNKKTYDYETGNGKAVNRTYMSASYKRRYEADKVVFDWLKNANVVELDIEEPNYLDKDHKVMWDKWRQGDGTAGKSNMSLHKDRHSRYTCKACGLRLKNVPYYNIPEGNGSKICVCCLYIRQEAIKCAFEGMPEKFRTSIVNELILGAM
jgi:hypothetical protein